MKDLRAHMFKPTVLVVDDSCDDLALIKMAVKRIPCSINLRTAGGGQQALDYLSAVSSCRDPEAYPMPALILLDLKMPRMDGFDVLARLDIFELTPKPSVVVMSSSGLPQDVERAMALGAAAFHVKPASIDELAVMLEKIFVFFCNSQVVPKQILA